MEINVNSYVGVLQEDRYVFTTHGLEELYMTHLLCVGSCIPVVMPRTAHELYAGKRVKIDAFPRISRKRVNGKRGVFAYLSCLDIELTDNTYENRYVKIYGKVMSHMDLIEGDDRVTSMHFELECTVPTGNGRTVTALAPCRAFDNVARKMQSLKKGDMITVTGYISGDRESLRVVVNYYIKDEAQQSDFAVG